MAWAASTTERTIMGNKKVIIGTFSQASGDTGGTVATGLRVVDYFTCGVETNLSESSGTVTVTTANPGAAQAGYWIAIGL